MKYSCVLFDLDGTLIDSKDSIRRSYEYALRKMNHPITEIKDINPFIGPTIIDAFQEKFGVTLEEAQEGYGFYLEEYLENGRMYTAPLYQGVKKTLEELVELGCFIGIATTKNQVNARKIVHRLLPDLFEDKRIYGTLSDGSRSGKSEIITDLLKDNHQSDLSQVVMVGDRFYDIEGGNTVGIHTLGVSYGCGGFDELKNAGATYIISDIVNLIPIVKGENNEQ